MKSSFQIKYTLPNDEEEYQQFNQNNENYMVTWEPIPNVPIFDIKNIPEELESLLYETNIIND